MSSARAKGLTMCFVVRAKGFYPPPPKNKISEISLRYNGSTTGVMPWFGITEIYLYIHDAFSNAWVYNRMIWVTQKKHLQFTSCFENKRKWSGTKGRPNNETFGAGIIFFILAHSVNKMWIIREPNMLELWNKLHFEEKRTESIYHV
jgi:hypothetical protein